MGKLIDFIVTAFAFIAGTLLVLMTVSIGYAILSRAVGLPFPLWVVQFNEYALLWITFLGTAWVLGRNRHIAIDLMTRRLGPRTKAVFEFLHSVVGAGVCAVIFWFGIKTVLSLYQRGVTDVSAVDIPRYLVLLVIPLGFLLLAFQFVRKVFTGALSIRASAPIHGEAARGAGRTVK
ncbi:MAG: TRAP transporter small permease [Desulfomonile sp.]|nr:TRAP transporter small permease [Desulfomonile sp.]